MALGPVTVANNIAGISISGVTIKKPSQMLDSVSMRDCPLLMPGPVFVTAFQHQRNSTGIGSAAKQTAYYTLNYRFFLRPVGSDYGLKDSSTDLTTYAGLIIDAFISNSEITGAVDVVPQPISGFGVVPDPAGNSFHGFDIAVKVMEFVN